MDRRSVLMTAVCAGLAARTAKAGSRVPIVGFLAIASRQAHVADIASFREGLVEAGLVEGRTVIIEERYGEGNPGRLAGLIEEFVALGVDVFLVPGPTAARAIRKRTPTPVVAVALTYSNHHPDLFEALNKPGGSITGFSLGSEELSAKRIQILREAVPDISTLAILYNAKDPIYLELGVATDEAARAQRLKTVILELTAPDGGEVERLMQAAKAADAQGMIVIRDFVTSTMAEQIAQAAIGAGIACLSEQRDICAAGGLLSYGANIPDLFRRGAAYVAKILNGSDPGDLPIQLPTKFDFVINQKTADALGLAIPSGLLVQATEVIE